MSILLYNFITIHTGIFTRKSNEHSFIPTNFRVCNIHFIWGKYNHISNVTRDESNNFDTIALKLVLFMLSRK